MAASNVHPMAVAPVVKSVRLACSAATAFEVFSRDIHLWWPTASHSLLGATAQVAFEPRLGGRLYERRDDGEERLWGTVLAWQPPARLAFSWHVGSDPDTAQAVEVTFATVAGGTDVTLVHSGWERLGADAARLRAEYDGGWNRVFVQRYAEHARGASTS